MGIIKNYSNSEVIEPPNEIVALEERFVFHRPITLVIGAKLFTFTEDDYTIKDDEGMDYFKCSGNSLNISNKKIIYDLYDLPLLNIKNQILSLRDKVTVYLGETEEEVFATVTQKSMVNVTKYTLDFFNQAKDKKEFLDLKCDIVGNSCGVFYGKEKEGAPMIGKITRKIESSTYSYTVEIAPKVDIALMVAATICFDQLKKE
ncbi:hypothetical protein BCR32DRAFT_325066 [Anaeromyces robustus]|uniref:DUF567-domain-containing protein n=1 Tax=Anaeromyces robustus TaxID=1754192 RepID=A0A1Y1XKC8_9FUNG|nr:hypothetical protein BCR32DRAFT_325066 [Anaeromyces robustus]|eukprot:ORX86172.1 hypothetical protein BCR32DRAFT_325066 [Anaeromyces robustus]